MIDIDERKAIELAARGKSIRFHTRYHWILTWIEEQPGKSLADKLWNVVNRAYQADYLRRGMDAYAQYRQCGSSDLDGQIAALGVAMECYSRAGQTKRYDELRRMITDVVIQKYVVSQEVA